MLDLFHGERDERGLILWRCLALKVVATRGGAGAYASVWNLLDGGLGRAGPFLPKEREVGRRPGRDSRWLGGKRVTVVELRLDSPCRAAATPAVAATNDLRLTLWGSDCLKAGIQSATSIL